MYILDASAYTLFLYSTFPTEDILLWQRRRVEGAYKEVVCSIWADMSITVSDNYTAAAIDRRKAAVALGSIYKSYEPLYRSSRFRSSPTGPPTLEIVFN